MLPDGGRLGQGVEGVYSQLPDDDDFFDDNLKRYVSFAVVASFAIWNACCLDVAWSSGPCNPPECDGAGRGFLVLIWLGTQMGLAVPAARSLRTLFRSRKTEGNGPFWVGVAMSVIGIVLFVATYLIFRR